MTLYYSEDGKHWQEHGKYDEAGLADAVDGLRQAGLFWCVDSGRAFPFSPIDDDVEDDRETIAPGDERFYRQPGAADR